MPNRAKQGVQIAAAIFVVSWLILIAANVDPIDRQCPWEFPKLASCLLSARETLVAGLAAAGGALFAAWLAWGAIRDQIAFEMARDAAAKVETARGKIRLAEAELTGLALTVANVRKMIGGFRGIDASSEWNYVDDLRRTSKSGNLSFYSQPLPSPFAGVANHLSNRLATLAARIEATDRDPSLRQADAPAGMTTALRSAYIGLDRAIKETVDDHIAFVSDLIAAIRERETIIEIGKQQGIN